MKKLMTLLVLSLSLVGSTAQAFFFGCGWYRSCCPVYNSGHESCCEQGYSYNAPCDECCTGCYEEVCTTCWQ